MTFLRRHQRLCILGGIGVVVAFVLWTAYRSGAGIDQNLDQRFLIDNFHRWGVVDRFGYFANSPAQLRVEESYGFTFHAIAFALDWAFSAVRGHDFDPFSASAYAHRNVLIALLSLGAFWGVYHVTRSLTGRRRVAAAASVLLALTPVFTGHALMNQKDVALAVGFTTLTAGTVALIGRMLRRNDLDDAALVERFGSRWSTGLLLAMGISFTIGARPASVVAVSVDAVLLVCVAVATRTHRSWRELREPAIGLASGALLVLATNPASLPNPLAWLSHAVATSSDFFWRNKILVDGQFHDSAFQPRWYMPYLLAVQTPLVIAALGVIGTWFMVVRSFTTKDVVRRVIVWLPVLVQLLLLPLGALAKGSLFYNAVRQALFVLPMFAVVAAVGLMALDRLLRGRRLRVIVATLVAVGALSPLVDTTTLYPYQYVYFNELVRSPDLTDRFEFDYWGISARETQQWVNEHYPTAVEVYAYDWIFPPYGAEGISFAFDWKSAGDREKVYAGNYYPSWGSDTYSDCPVVHRVTRHLWASEILLGYVRRCTGIR